MRVGVSAPASNEQVILPVFTARCVGRRVNDLGLCFHSNGRSRFVVVLHDFWSKCAFLSLETIPRFASETIWSSPISQQQSSLSLVLVCFPANSRTRGCGSEMILPPQERKAGGSNLCATISGGDRAGQCFARSFRRRDVVP